MNVNMIEILIKNIDNAVQDFQPPSTPQIRNYQIFCRQVGMFLEQTDEHANCI